MHADPHSRNSPGRRGSVRLGLARRGFARLGLAWAILVGGAWGVATLGGDTSAHAQTGPTLNVSIDRQQIEPGETIKLRISVAKPGAQPARSELEAPDLVGWRLVGRFERTSYDSLSRTNTTVIELTLQPERVGRLPIGAFKLITGGSAISSDPLVVQVGTVGGAPGKQPPGQPTPGQPTPGQPPPTAPRQPTPTLPGAPGFPGDPGATATEIAPDSKAFLAWEVDRTEPWLGQQINARLYVFLNTRYRVSRFEMGDVNLSGFWNADSTRQRRPRADSVRLGAATYTREVVQEYTLFPLRAGALTLPAAKASIRLAASGVFGPRTPEEIERSAAPIVLNVRPLPPDGRPHQFAGPAVGRVSIEARTNRNRLDADDPLQLTVTTTVEGLIQNVPRVELPKLDGLRAFPPSETETTSDRNGKVIGTRRQTWLLRATRGGRVSVPSLSVPYFDPLPGRYDIARTAPLHLTVTGTPGTDADAPPAGAEPGAVESTALPLRDIRDQVDVTAIDRSPTAGAAFWLAAFAPPLLFFGWIALDRVRRRRAAEAGPRAARNAARATRAQLDAARRAGADAPAAVVRALYAYLDTRFGRPFQGLTHPQLRKALADHGVPEATVNELIVELENCDFARFGPAATSADTEASVARAQTLVAQIEEAVR